MNQREMEEHRKHKLACLMKTAKDIRRRWQLEMTVVFRELEGEIDEQYVLETIRQWNRKWEGQWHDLVCAYVDWFHKAPRDDGFWELQPATEESYQACLSDLRKV